MSNPIGLHKQNVRRCFNKSAQTYDENSVVQQQIGARLVRHLLQHTQYMEKIIDLGCGSGLTTEHLAAEMRYQQFHAVDIADRLLMKAQPRLNSYGIRPHEADFESWSSISSGFDLVFSNMALHWSLCLADTLKNIHLHLHDAGLIAFSLPLQNTFQELPRGSKNHFISLEQARTLIEEIGFDLLFCHDEYISVLFESQLSAVKSIKAAGCNYVVTQQPSLRRAQNDFNDNEPYSLTYHPGYFIARKIP